MGGEKHKKKIKNGIYIAIYSSINKYAYIYKYSIYFIQGFLLFFLYLFNGYKNLSVYLYTYLFNLLL